MERTKSVRVPYKPWLIGMVGIVCGITAFTASSGIVGSRHDLRTFLGLGANAELCVVCHTPHDADGNTGTGTLVAGAPLWNHAETAATFTMYSAGGSTTLDGTEDPQPTGASKLCLSCHDGTVGVDNYGGGSNTAGPLPPTNPFYVGVDLQTQHPISITYEDGLDPGLQPQTNTITVGGYTPPGGTPFPSRTGTIAELLIPDGKVQCSSCHDVHNTLVATSAAMLRVDMSNSSLCLTCHNK